MFGKKKELKPLKEADENLFLEVVRSLRMVFDPEIGGGVVILTNSDEGADLVQEVAVHVMGQTPGWGIP